MTLQVGGSLSRLLPQRTRISFRSVNRSDRPGYEPGIQRHHLQPLQILGRGSFARMFGALGRERIDFDDFRRNGLLLPANDRAALRIGLPLHRGPHRDYNAMVIERVGQIEERWSTMCRYAPEEALLDAYQRLELLQQSLRQRLLDQRRRLLLNARDPLGAEVDFSELDAMVDQLWPATEPGKP